MDSYHKQIRRRLQSMAPKRAIAYVMSAQLPPDEAVCVIECDIKRKSYCETAFLVGFFFALLFLVFPFRFCSQPVLRIGRI